MLQMELRLGPGIEKELSNCVDWRHSRHSVRDTGGRGRDLVLTWFLPYLVTLGMS